jgi:RIO-like serine/threonine protein kinase
MNELTLLRALARLSRMRRAVDLEALALRAGGSVEDVRAAVARLSRASLVDRTGGLRLTMAGLAVAVASSAPVRQASPRRAVRRKAA